MPTDTSPIAEAKPSGFFASLRKGKRGNAPKLPVQDGDPQIRELVRRVDAISSTDGKLRYLLGEMENRQLDGKGRVLKVLAPVFESHHVRSESVTRIWTATAKCLLSNHLDVRILAFQFMTKCIESQRQNLSTSLYYDSLKDHVITAEELPYMLEALCALTQDGKNVDDLQETILALLCHWIGFCVVASRHNSANFTSTPIGPTYRMIFKLLQAIFESQFDRFLEEHVVKTLEFLCNKVATSTSDPQVIGEILAVIESIPRFGGVIPSAAVFHVINFVCLYSAIKLAAEYSDQFWRIIYSFLSIKNVAHSALRLLEDIPMQPLTPTSHSSDTRDLRRHRNRGALVLLGKCLEEASTPHNTMKATLTVSRAIQSFAKAVRHQELSIDDMALKELQRILRSDAVATLSFEDWEVVWTLLNTAIRDYTMHESRIVQSGIPVNGEGSPDERTRHAQYGLRMIRDQLKEIASELRDFCRTEAYTGAMTECVSFHMVLSRAMEVEPSVHELILGHYKDAGLCLPGNPDWLVECRVILDDYVRNEKRNIAHRHEAMDILWDVIILVDPMEEDFNRRILYPLFQLVRTDNTIICESLIRLAVEIAEPAKEPWIVDLTKNLFARSLEEPSSNFHSRHTSRTSSEVTIAVNAEPSRDLNVEAASGLVKIFEKSIVNNSPSLAQKLFSDLVHLSQKSVKDVRVRLEVMDALLRLRACSLYCVYTEDRNPQSPDKPLASDNSQQRPPTPTPTQLATNGSSKTSGGSQARTRSEIIPPSRLKTYDDHVWDDDTDEEEAARTNSRETMAMQRQTFILPVGLYLEAIIDILREEGNWYVYNRVLRYFPDQLLNKTFFMGCDSAIIRLREVMCQQQLHSQFPKFDFSHSERTDVIMRLHHILTALIGYHDLFVKASKDELVRCFYTNMGRYNPTITMMCIHALMICCHELPNSTARSLAGILQTLSHLITNPSLSIHILEFLVGVGRIPKIHDNFTSSDFMTVFQIALKYLQFKYSDRESLSGDEGRLSQYIIYLAYEALTVWYLAVRLENRRAHVHWIVRQLILANAPNDLDHFAQAFVDMLERFSFSDSPLRKYPDAAEVEGLAQYKKHWAVGESIRTAQVVREDGLVKVFVRKPASMLVTYCQAEVDFDSDAIRTGRKKLTQAELNTLASYMITQMYTPRNPPILLSDDEATLRSIRSLDRMPVVNYHSIGITYVGWGQKTEEDILSNEFGSLEYQSFLNAMGQFIPLKGNTGIYTGGLDTADDQDGTHALFWSDKTTQVTFITYTMIPLNKTGDRNLALTNKKRNAANCFVNIIWNDSNDPYALDTISSEFNSNSIVISRHSRMSHESDFVVSGEISPRERSFFKVKLLQTKDMPPVSPILTEKIISDSSLAPFVRSVALKLSIFCQIYIGRQERSHWVARLEQIKRIRANALSKRESIDSTSTGRTILTPSPSTSRMSSISSTTTARKTPTPDAKLLDPKNDNWEEERLEEFLDKYDFTRYT